MISSPNRSISSDLCADSARPDADLIAIQLQCDKIARDLKLPPCPTIIQEFAKVMDDENADQRRIAGLVGKDLALAASVLKTVNSASYGLRRETASIQHAITVIGLRNTAGLITRLMIRQSFASSAGRLMQEFWDQSAKLADIADRVAPAIKSLDPEEARTYLLFRNAGQAVMINRYAEYGRMFELHSGGLMLQAIAEEQRAFEMSHAQIGYVLAKEWCLPETIALAIFFHHDLAYFTNTVATGAKQIRRLIAFGFLVDQLSALEAGSGVISGWEQIEQPLLETLRISPDEIVSLVADAAAN
jgi:HD-like signal output (HDOD) protein